VFVDSSAWFALLVSSDRHHARAVAEWSAIRRSGSRIVASEYVADESLTLLKSRRGATGVGEGRKIMQPPVERWHLTEVGFQETYELFEKHRDQSCSFTDCSTVVLMRQQAATELFTFDADFRVFPEIREIPTRSDPRR
jgi:predicted nucleic acid-binding protein